MRIVICVCVCVCVCVAMGGGAFGAEKIVVQREVTPNVEYFKQTEHGLTKIKEYGQGERKIEVKEYYEMKDGSLRKIREVKPNVQIPERGRGK